MAIIVFNIQTLSSNKLIKVVYRSVQSGKWTKLMESLQMSYGLFKMMVKQN